MNAQELRLCVDALYENAVDGRLADIHGISFEEAERRLAASFLIWLRTHKARVVGNG